MKTKTKNPILSSLCTKKQGVTLSAITACRPLKITDNVQSNLVSMQEILANRIKALQFLRKATRYGQCASQYGKPLFFRELQAVQKELAEAMVFDFSGKIVGVLDVETGEVIKIETVKENV
jgi:hypothetical protein